MSPDDTQRYDTHASHLHIPVHRQGNPALWLNQRWPNTRLWRHGQNVLNFSSIKGHTTLFYQLVSLKLDRFPEFILTGVFIQTECSTQPPLLGPSHSLMSLHTLMGQTDRKKCPVTLMGLYVKVSKRQREKWSAGKVKTVFYVRMKWCWNSPALCVWHAVWERGGAADGWKTRAGERDKTNM